MKAINDEIVEHYIECGEIRRRDTGELYWEHCGDTIGETK